MTITLLVSPLGHGKTRQCLESVRSAQAELALRPAWVVVPDRLQTLAVRMRLAAAGGAIEMRVGTFGDLYQMVLLRASGPVPTLSQS